MTVQVGLVEPALPPETVQPSVTAPVNPPEGVTVMVELPVVVGEVIAIGVPESEKEGVAVGPTTVTARVVLFVTDPAVPAIWAV